MKLNIHNNRFQEWVSFITCIDGRNILNKGYKLDQSRYSTYHKKTYELKVFNFCGNLYTKDIFNKGVPK